MRKHADNKKSSKVVWLETLGRNEVRMLVVVPMTAVPTLNNALIDSAESIMLDKGSPESIRKRFSALQAEIKDFLDEMEETVKFLEASKKDLEGFSTSPVEGPTYTTEPNVFRIEGIWRPSAEMRTINDLASALKSEGFDPQIERYLG